MKIELTQDELSLIIRALRCKFFDLEKRGMYEKAIPYDDLNEKMHNIRREINSNPNEEHRIMVL